MTQSSSFVAGLTPSTNCASTPRVPPVPGHSAVLRITEPLTGISVFCALDEIGDASLDGILTAMASYRLVHLCSVQDLNSAGFELLAAGTRPHFTLCHAEPATTLDAERLLEVLGSPQPNPYHRRPPTGR